jgi:hypothetical protein
MARARRSAKSNQEDESADAWPQQQQRPHVNRGPAAHAGARESRAGIQQMTWQF